MRKINDAHETGKPQKSDAGSGVVAGVGKPEKPTDDFPLFAHANGQWCKKVRQKLHYFGPWADPDGALDRWVAEKDYLTRGRTPPKITGDELTVGVLCDSFLHSKAKSVETGELHRRTYAGYHSACKRMASYFGRNRLADDLTASDFEELRTALAKGRGLVTLRGDVLTIRMVFKSAHENGILKSPPRFGQSFKIPDRAALRRSRQANGKRMFEADELRKVIAKAPMPLKAMILLGINCGFGATDCASLPQSAVGLKTAWIDFPRPKTAVDRKCPLWPDTVKALREAIDARPVPRDRADDGLVFLTRCGQRWVRVGTFDAKKGKGASIDAVCCEMVKLLTDLGLKRPGLAFYALRHTFETIGGDSGDQIAVNAIMGHVDNSMAAAYRERIDEARLRKVSDFVRSWLFPAKRRAK